MPPTATRPTWQRSAFEPSESSPLPSCSLRHNVTIREFRLPNVPFRQLAPYSYIRGSKSPKWTIFVCQVAISGGRRLPGSSSRHISSVEVAVYERLHPTSQWVEERRYHQGGDDCGKFWLLLLARFSKSAPQAVSTL